jgi:hypothetical protein
MPRCAFYVTSPTRNKTDTHSLPPPAHPRALPFLQALKKAVYVAKEEPTKIQAYNDVLSAEIDKARPPLGEPKENTLLRFPIVPQRSPSLDTPRERERTKIPVQTAARRCPCDLLRLDQPKPCMMMRCDATHDRARHRFRPQGVPRAQGLGLSPD